jgi:hypothetical protein
MLQEWKVEARFGEPERELFVRAGKEQLFDEIQRIFAVLIAGWRRR